MYKKEKEKKGEKNNLLSHNAASSNMLSQQVWGLRTFSTIFLGPAVDRTG